MNTDWCESPVREVSKDMLAASVARPVLVEREDRRAPRTAYRALVLIDGRPMAGRDISTKGLSILLKPTLEPGDVVRVTLAGATGSPDEVGTTARVARVEACPEGFVVGLQFIE
jgi:hypothetical protein